MANRTRNNIINFRVSDKEKEIIKRRMAAVGSLNQEDFLRKMVFNGYIVHLDLPELAEMTSLLRRSSNNLNQLTRRVHETGHFYDTDLEELRQSFDRLWDSSRKILRALSAIK